MAKKIRKIIEGQTIRIDDHRADGRSVHDWADTSSRIHLHKESNTNPKGKYIIRIPLNNDEQATVSYAKRNGHELDTLPKSIEKEIKKAFSDPRERDAFLKGVYEELGNFNWTRNKKDERRIAKRISRCFGLTIKTEVDIEKGDDRPSVVLFSDDKGLLYMFLQKYSSKQSFIGQFQPFSASGIHKLARVGWLETIEKHIGVIVNKSSDSDRDESIASLAVGASGIEQATICSTQKFFKWMLQ